MNQFAVEPFCPAPVAGAPFQNELGRPLSDVDRLDRLPPAAAGTDERIRKVYNLVVVATAHPDQTLKDNATDDDGKIVH